MATLTPLAKGLIGLAVIGGMASAVWNLGLKDYLAASSARTAPAPTTPGPTVAQPVTSDTALRAPPVAVPPPSTPPPSTPAAATAGGTPMTAAESGEKGRQLLNAGNYAQARIFLEQAVQMGDGPAACHLGEMTLNGQGGLTADREKAAKLYQLAQSRGLICFAMGQ